MGPRLGSTQDGLRQSRRRSQLRGSSPQQKSGAPTHRGRRHPRQTLDLNASQAHGVLGLPEVQPQGCVFSASLCLWLSDSLPQARTPRAPQAVSKRLEADWLMPLLSFSPRASWYDRGHCGSEPQTSFKARLGHLEPLTTFPSVLWPAQGPSSASPVS